MSTSRDIARALYETGLEAELARRIAKKRKWTRGPSAWRRRLMQMLGEYDPRHYPVDDLEDVLEELSDLAGSEHTHAIMGRLQDAIWRGRRRREERLEREERDRGRPGMAVVRARREMDRGVG